MASTRPSIFKSTPSDGSTPELTRTIGLGQAIALYIGAVVGAGVLVLPGAAASIAGPASILSWSFDALLGIPLALTFGAMASRYPDAGGVATYTRHAFGADTAAVVGWYYLVAAAVGEIIVPLAGAHYVAGYAGLERGGTYLLAAAILAVTIGANLRGLKIGGRLALALSAAVALMLLVATLSAVPRAGGHWTPFAPHGWMAVGAGAVFVFYAFFGWEVIAHLAEEFHNPERDVPRATVWSVGVITLLYFGIAAAVIGTRQLWFSRTRPHRCRSCPRRRYWRRRRAGGGRHGVADRAWDIQRLHCWSFAACLRAFPRQRLSASVSEAQSRRRSTGSSSPCRRFRACWCRRELRGRHRHSAVACHSQRTRHCDLCNWDGSRLSAADGSPPPSRHHRDIVMRRAPAFRRLGAVVAGCRRTGCSPYSAILRPQRSVASAV